MGYIAVVDYQVGNLMSVHNAMKYLGFSTQVTADAKTLEQADGIILPGVGAFPDAANRLRESGLAQVIQEESQKKPLLGICLGMQLLFQRGTEVRPTEGLGLIPGSVDLIQTSRKLPHIGWNSLHYPNPSPLFAGLPEEVYVYFVHSFCGNAANPANVIAATEYGPAVTAAVQSGLVFGAQFHPEKSGEIGLAILKNFGGLTK